MSNFLNNSEKKISNEFEKKGYIIKNIQSLNTLEKIRNILVESVKKKINFKKKDNSLLLNFFHTSINKRELNSIRVNIIKDLNKNKEIRMLYYQIAKPYLDILVGNELAMQLKINLSIQIPKDTTSLLPVHSDVWSGDSPFEIVVWLPLVDCYKTKTMYILPPKKYQKVKKIFSKKGKKTSETIFNSIKKNVQWINIKYGQILLFNQTLPHGNIVNNEKETRWTLNCRFKGIFTPYRDKKLGEFFEPITLRKISHLAIKYNLPEIK